MKFGLREIRDLYIALALFAAIILLILAGYLHAHKYIWGSIVSMTTAGLLIFSWFLLAERRKKQREKMQETQTRGALWPWLALVVYALMLLQFAYGWIQMMIRHAAGG